MQTNYLNMKKIISRILAYALPPIVAHRIVNIIHPLGIGEWFSYKRKGITGSYFKSNTKDLHGRFFYFFGYFDLKNVLLVNYIFRRLQNGNLCEIGANIGTETIAYSDIVASKGFVYAFEPEPNNFNQLLNQLYSYSNVKLFNNAISNIGGIMNFLKGDEVSSGTGKIYSADLEETILQNIIHVEAITLDSLKIDNVKIILIDVEGHEPFVISGAKNTILNCKPIIITEVSNKLLRKFGKTTIKGFLNEIEHLDYVCYRIGRIRLERLTMNTDSQKEDSNWICFPKGEDKLWVGALNVELLKRLFLPRFLQSLEPNN